MSLPLKIALKMAALSPAWLAVPLVIWWADPHGLLRPNPADGERARLVAAGETVVWPESANYRGFVQQVIPQISRREVVVLGSSRVFRIQGTAFAPRSFMNLGITCATLEELRGIAELLRREGKAPDCLIVGVDPWTFNPHHLQRSPDRCLRAKGEILSANPLAELKQTGLTFISPAYFQLSLQSWGRSAVQTFDDSAPIDDCLRRADGSFRFSELPVMSGAAVAIRVQRELRDRIWTEYEYESGDEPLRQAFAELVLSVPSAAILLVPLHPDLYHAVQAEPGCRRALEQETWLHSFADKHQIPVIGSFDPQKCGLTAADFIDASHCDERAMQRFSQELNARLMRLPKKDRGPAG